jgi:hypothetical protein
VILRNAERFDCFKRRIERGCQFFSHQTTARISDGEYGRYEGLTDKAE